MGRDPSGHAVLETDGEYVKRLMGLVHTAHQSDLDFKSDYGVILRALKSVMLCPKKKILGKMFVESLDFGF